MAHRFMTVGVLVVLVGGQFVPVGAQAASSPDAAVARLSSEVAYLERRLELARSDSFYLLLDPATTELTLMYGGAVLQLYPVHEMRIGRPRALFSAVGAPLDWRGVVWEAGVLDPAHPAVRTVRPEGDEDAVSSPVVPPTAEEAIPVPDRFRIRFEGGLALEVRSSAEADDAGWWARQRAAWALRWDDVFSALWPSDRDAVRLLVTLDRDAAGALYRALPPETRLLVSAEVPAAASK